MRLVLTVLMLLVLWMRRSLSLVVSPECCHVVVHVIVMLDVVLYIDSFKGSQTLCDDGPFLRHVTLVMKLWMMVRVGMPGGGDGAVVQDVHPGGDDLVGGGWEGVWRMGRVGFVLHQGPLKDGSGGGGGTGSGGIRRSGARHGAGWEEHSGTVEMVGGHERLVGGGGRVVVRGGECVGVGGQGGHVGGGHGP